MTNLRVPGGGKYYFTDAEIERICKCTTEVMAVLKDKGLTIAEVFEVLEQCKASLDELLVK